MCNMSGGFCEGKNGSCRPQVLVPERRQTRTSSGQGSRNGEPYMAPPENAIVLAIDEKPSIQAFERAQGYLKLPNGRAITGQSHDYKRNGTTTLFAALDLKSGKVVGRHNKRRRRVEFSRLHEQGRRRSSGSRNPCRARQSLDPQAQARHVTQASQERAFPLHPDACLLAQPGRNRVLDPRGSIARGSLVPKRSRTHRPYRGFHPDYNETVKPFVWTKSEVHQKRLKVCFAD